MGQPHIRSRSGFHRSGSLEEQALTTTASIDIVLEAQGANPFRVQAYRGGAETIRGLKTQVQSIVEAYDRPAKKKRR